MDDCIFCQIINKKLPAELIFENNNFICIKDINPKAETHLLLIPKKHLVNLYDLEADNNEHNSLMAEAMSLLPLISKQQNLPSFRTVINNGKESGQIVFHLHFHLLSGKGKK